jgi:hypothetical protein
VCSQPNWGNSSLINILHFTIYIYFYFFLQSDR